MGVAPGVITLDTSALYALLNQQDPDHAVVLAELRADTGPYLVPAGIMAEVAYLVESRLGHRAMDALLADLESGAYSLDCGEDDLPRIRALAARRVTGHRAPGNTSIVPSRATTSKSRLSRVSTRPPFRSAQATTDASTKPSGRSS